MQNVPLQNCSPVLTGQKMPTRCLSVVHNAIRRSLILQHQALESIILARKHLHARARTLKHTDSISTWKQILQRPPERCAKLFTVTALSVHFTGVGPRPSAGLLPVADLPFPLSPADKTRLLEQCIQLCPEGTAGWEESCRYAHIQLLEKKKIFGQLSLTKHTHTDRRGDNNPTNILSLGRDVTWCFGQNPKMFQNTSFYD